MTYPDKLSIIGMKTHPRIEKNYRYEIVQDFMCDDEKQVMVHVWNFVIIHSSFLTPHS